MNATFRGPRFGGDARPERDGQRLMAEPCRCLTCVDMGAWLTERHFHITFTADGVSCGHVPARWLVECAP
jgi:hypothetical protein